MQHRFRTLDVESLEARRVLSCDFTMDGVCDADDLDAMYALQGTLSGRASIHVDYPFGDTGELVVEAITRDIHPDAVAGNPSLARGRVFDLYVSAPRDLLTIDVSLNVAVGSFHNEPPPLANDSNAPHPTLRDVVPSLHADSWVRTSARNPSSFDVLGTESTFTALDTVTEIHSDFHFARIVLLPDDNGAMSGRFEAFAQLADIQTPTFHEFSVELTPATIRNQFSFDTHRVIDSRDIPGWLASASVHNADGLSYRRGDLNLDGNVDSGDLGQLLNSFSADDGVGWRDGDLDMNGVVDSEDLGMLLVNFGFEGGATSESISHASESINAFAGDLYEQLQKEDGNVVFSPLSIANALTMTYAGARGQTATEMENVLHLDADSGIHESYQNLLRNFAQTPEPTQIEVANAIWPSASYPVRDDFAASVLTNYRANAQNLDYSNPDLAEEVINAWVEETTMGRIRDLVNELDPTTVMVLTNTVFFKSIWDSPFNPEFTTTKGFTTGTGAVVDTDMMLHPFDSLSGDSSIRFATIDGFEVMELPFRGRTASMVIMLPPANEPSELSTATFANINDWVDGDGGLRPDCGTTISMPRFETNVSTDLTDLLPAMGMPTAFGGGADFTGMFDSRGPFIDMVNHKAFLEVTELGAEAAAASAVELGICFATGTPVLTPDGPRPIESIRVGDYVLARDERDSEGCVRPQLVEELFDGKKQVLRLQIAGQVIRPTDTHPFFVKDQGWTPAGELRPGDLLSTRQGTWVPVDEVTVGDTLPVHNFRVAEFHTYFIGDEECGVWVHNCCSAAEPFNVDREFHFVIRDNMNDTTLFMGRISDPTQLENELAPSPTAPTVALVSPIIDPARFAVPDALIVDGVFDDSDLEFDSGHFGNEVCVSPHETPEALYAMIAKVQRVAQRPYDSHWIAATDDAISEMDSDSELDRNGDVDSTLSSLAGRSLKFV